MEKEFDGPCTLLQQMSMTRCLIVDQKFGGAMVKANFAVCFDAQAESPGEKLSYEEWKN